MIHVFPFNNEIVEGKKKSLHFSTHLEIFSEWKIAIYDEWKTSFGFYFMFSQEFIIAHCIAILCCQIFRKSRRRLFIVSNGKKVETRDAFGIPFHTKFLLRAILRLNNSGGAFLQTFSQLFQVCNFFFCLSRYTKTFESRISEGEISKPLKFFHSFIGKKKWKKARRFPKENCLSIVPMQLLPEQTHSIPVRAKSFTMRLASLFLLLFFVNS